jgi:hypothetical protein
VLVMLKNSRQAHVHHAIASRQALKQNRTSKIGIAKP